MDNGTIEKTRYSDEELEEFRHLIERRLSKEREEFEYFMQQLRDLTDSADSKIKGLDDGTGTADATFLNDQIARKEKLIKHLESAHIRIKNKVYGICRVTGKLIPKERLRAVPHATVLAEVKQNGKA